MAKRTTRLPGEPSGTAAQPPTKARGARDTNSPRDVASEMAGGQDQAAAMSDQFVGVASTGNEPVQGKGPGSPASTSMSSPSDEDIRMRAYHRYLERGGGHGMDFEDWLEAERDLKARR
jgi:hypothetical protein